MTSAPMPLTNTRPIEAGQVMAGSDSTKSIIACTLKLKLRPAQERRLNRWLWHLTGVWNWTVRKIELDGRDGLYLSRRDVQDLLTGCSGRLGIPLHTVRGVAQGAREAWARCYRGLGRKPRFKGRRNRLNSIPLPDPIKRPDRSRISVLGLGSVKFHSQDIPAGPIKCARLIKRASGWRLCLFVEAQPVIIEHVADKEIGIDPGFRSLVALSSGELINHPRELEASAARLARAQRGNRQRLTARLHERIGNQRKHRNHQLSRRLVSENALIAFSADNHRGIARRFGKSVSSSGHYQLRQMLAYKCRAGGRQYVEVNPKNSTRTCSACRALTGPTGYAGLSVRHWTCSACGAAHDRDVNAAINTLAAGRGARHERAGDSPSGIALLSNTAKLTARGHEHV